MRALIAFVRVIGHSKHCTGIEIVTCVLVIEIKSHFDTRLLLVVSTLHFDTPVSLRGYGFGFAWHCFAAREVGQVLLKEYSCFLIRHEAIKQFTCIAVLSFFALKRWVMAEAIKVDLVGNLSVLLILPWNEDAIVYEDKAPLDSLIRHITAFWWLAWAVLRVSSGSN